MTENNDMIAVIVIVALAVVAVGVKIYRSFRKVGPKDSGEESKPGCSGCSGSCHK